MANWKRTADSHFYVNTHWEFTHNPTIRLTYCYRKTDLNIEHTYKRTQGEATLMWGRAYQLGYPESLGTRAPIWSEEVALLTPFVPYKCCHFCGIIFCVGQE